MLAEQLTRALMRQAIPVIGVSIGKSDDRTTWRIDYDPSATAAQRTAGETLKATFDPAVDPIFLDETAQNVMNTQVAKALCALMLQVKLNRALTTADIPAVQQMFADARAYYKFIVNNNL
jgi:hypothetical protein